MRQTNLSRCVVLAASLLLSISAFADEPQWRHGMSLMGDVKYKPDFKHYDYVNPDAPKGGELRLWSIGTFDNVNPFIAQGRPTGCGCVETLMTGNADEHSTMYGLIAEYMEVPDDQKWVVFKLRDEAKWWDGTAITADDVIFSLEKLKAEGQPAYRQYFKNLVRPEKLGDKVVKINFDVADGEVNKVLDPFTRKSPPLSATDHLGVINRLWVVTDTQAIAASAITARPLASPL